MKRIIKTGTSGKPGVPIDIPETIAEVFDNRWNELIKRLCDINKLRKPRMDIIKEEWDQAQKEVENIYKRDVDNVAKMLLNKGGKKYKSCTAPRGQYCKKHGVVHKEMKEA